MQEDFEAAQNIMQKILDISLRVNALEAEKKLLKQQLHAYVEQHGGKIGFDGIGSAYIVKGVKKVSYDTSAIESLIVTLVQNGETHTAQALSDIRTESQGEDYIVVKKK